MNRRQIFGGTAAGAAAIATVGLAQPSLAKPTSGLRISCEKGDPGEHLYAELCADGKHVTVYFNGKEQKGCLTADPGLSLIKRHVETEKGNYAHTPQNGFVYETVYGHVRWTAE